MASSTTVDDLMVNDVVASVVVAELIHALCTAIPLGIARILDGGTQHHPLSAAIKHPSVAEPQ